jgi:hypothetical protein
MYMTLYMCTTYMYMYMCGTQYNVLLLLSLSLSLLQSGKATSPNKSYLEFLTLPNDDNTKVDLRQVATVTLSHLDRLAQPYTSLDMVSLHIE